MKAIVIREPGGPDKLIYQDVPTPQVKEGWSLVKVKGFGINHSEIFTHEGKSPSVQFPRSLGIECVGGVAESIRRAACACSLLIGSEMIAVSCLPRRHGTKNRLLTPLAPWNSWGQPVFGGLCKKLPNRKSLAPPIHSDYFLEWYNCFTQPERTAP